MGLTIDMSEYGLPRLRSAIRTAFQGAPAALGGHLPSTDRLKLGAQATLAEQDSDVSKYFQSMLELGYLVASADGFAEEERHALAELLEAVTGEAVKRDVLDLHFKDLEEAVEMLGRHERLRRAAADFEDGMSKGEALGFAALVALADGKLGELEASALKEMGANLGLSADEIDEAIEEVISNVKNQLSIQGMNR
jgi:tellurite resistance protein